MASTPLNGWPSVRTGTIVIGLVLVALVLRLWELGERPLHHDESLDAWWSWLFRNGKYNEYDPVYHGPLRFYVTAGFYEIFGESEATARLFSALTGTAVVGLPWFLRRELGRAGTIAAAVALCVSPTMLYYSRFGREDAQMVFLTLLAMVLGLAYLNRPRTITAAGLAFVLSCSFAIKESTYLFVLLLAVYLLIVLAAQFEAKARVDAGLASDESLSPWFMTAALLFASVGLLAAVIVGSASDELFNLIGVYMAALAAFVLVAALPQLRKAGIRWSFANAALAVTSAGALFLTGKASGADTAPWELSSLAVVLAAPLAAVAAAFLIVPSLRAVPRSLTWAAAAGIGAAGIAVKELIERAHDGALVAADAPPAVLPDWNTSIPMLVIGAVILLAGLAALLSPVIDPEGARSVLTETWARAGATVVALIGLAVLLNEYVEAESNRLIALLVVAVIAASGALLANTLPHTTNNDFEWPPVARSFGAIGWLGWFITFVVFAVTWFFFFTIWGRVKGDWASGFTRAINYWDSQQEVNRGGQPWNYYLFALPAYEWMFVGLGGVGTWRALRKPTVLSGLFVWFAVGSLILYSYAGERMPWLIAHPLLPLLILAGMGVQQLWQHRSHRAVPAIAAVVGFALLATIGTSIRASFPNGADGREILSQAGQATPHLTAALDRLENIDKISIEQTGEPAMLAIGDANSWPYAWYLRDRIEAGNAVWFNNETGPPADGSIDVIIADYSAINPENMPEFSSTVFAMRSWWVPTYTEAGPLGWFSYVRNRELWEQGPSNFVGVREPVESEAEGGLRASIGRIKEGANAQSSGFVYYTGADGSVVDEPDPNAFIEPDDGRDGCGSVDQWFLVRNELATIESQVYPAPIEAMGPLACASDLLATS